MATRLAPLPISAPPANGRRSAGRQGHYRQRRDRPALGREIQTGFCRNHPPARQFGEKGHLDEVVIAISGQKHWLWRAVDQGGLMLHALVQSRRDEQAAAAM